jgi:hypothetical protein
MDTYTLLFLVAGILLTVIPLRTVQEWFGFASDGLTHPLSFWTLLVPVVGIVFIGVALLSHHKEDLRCLFFNVCTQIDQTGYGYGLGTALLGMLSPFETNDNAGMSNRAPIDLSTEITPLSVAEGQVNIRE